MSKVIYKNFHGVNVERFFIGKLLNNIASQKGCDIKVLGPFERESLITKWARIFDFKDADLYITGENLPPEFRRAKKQIGFWRSYKERDDVFRFPNWMWHLDWPEIENQPPYPRYGMRLSIDRLMRPISETYSVHQLKARFNRAILFSKHLKEPRRRLFHLTKDVIGCDGIGGYFGEDNRHKPKMPVMENYLFSLCPENSIGDGYITEKVPEAFHSGCIPITWCLPEDLAEDFNPEAIVNLYGLDDIECIEVLTELKRGGEYFHSLLNQPLLLKRPSLKPIIEFISGD